ncbi:MAG: 1-acyl-sn-glycerol-3-phosphate acyltransferase [Treponemataceae bacterium]|nr:1-acyl-sn-glycerol-3-phosphate acyltransferase [Treponemataceae bacterium]
MAYRRGGPLIVDSVFFSIASRLTLITLWPIAWLLDFILYRIRTKNRWRIRELRKTHKKAILVANHTTWLDPILMTSTVVPIPLYHTSFEPTMRVKFLGTFIQLLGGMPIPSGRSGKERFLDGIKLALKKRPFIHIYPEGLCFLHNQKVNKFHQGAFLASMELNLPIVPIATVFSEPKKILGWKSVRPRATVYIMDPIFPDKFESATQYAEYTRQLIQSEIDKRHGTNAYAKGEIKRLDVIKAQE